MTEAKKPLSALEFGDHFEWRIFDPVDPASDQQIWTQGVVIQPATSAGPAVGRVRNITEPVQLKPEGCNIAWRRGWPSVKVQEIVVSVMGDRGVGKSTLAAMISDMLTRCGSSVVTDDPAVTDYQKQGIGSDTLLTRQWNVTILSTTDDAESSEVTKITELAKQCHQDSHTPRAPTPGRG